MTSPGRAVADREMTAVRASTVALGPLIPAADVARILVVVGTAAAIGSGAWRAFGHPGIAGAAVTVAAGYSIFKDAIEDLLNRRMTMELSMTIALVAALAIGEVFTALLITGFVLAAEDLEHLTVSRGRRALTDLMQFLPRRVSVRREGQLVEIGLDELRVGDPVFVRPGGRIPVDGLVVDGESSVDQATITGESVPVDVRPGRRVFAGSMNLSGAISIEWERMGRDTTFGQIVEAVEHADRQRAPIQKISDRLAGYLVYGAMAAAVVTFLVTRDLRATIAVIIVAGACGVAAGTPLAIVGAIGRAARFGCVIKGGIHLEALWSIDTVVLDKTGTVTYGDLRVQRVSPAHGVSIREVIEAAIIAEARSEHPVGRAIAKHASAQGFAVREPLRFMSIPGQGVLATWGGGEIRVGNREFVGGGRPLEGAVEVRCATNVFVVCHGRFLGSIALADVPRPEAKAAIAELRSLGIRSCLLTGDSQLVAERIARDLRVDEFEAGLMPDAKAARVRAMSRTDTSPWSGTA